MELLSSISLHILLPGAVPPQGQSFPSPLAEFQEVPVSLFLKSVEVPQVTA